MIRRCYMVVDWMGQESVYLLAERAHDYASLPRVKGRIINMFGHDADDDEGITDVIDITATIVPEIQQVNVIDPPTQIMEPTQ